MATRNTKTAARDLEATKFTLVGHKNGPGSDPVAVYSNSFKGKEYVHVRPIWFSDDEGKWLPGKGFSIVKGNARAVLAAIGKCAASF